MQVHAWSEDDVTTVLLGLVTNGLAHLAYQFGVPCRGQTGSDGECRSVERLVSTLAGGVNTYTGRTVGQHGSGDTESWDGRRCSCCTGYEVSLAANDGRRAKEVVSTANEQFGLLFESHGFQYLIDIVSSQLWLCIHCHCC